MQGLSFNRVTLKLNDVPRTLEFPVPVRESKVILKQLQFDLEAHPPQAAILSVEVQLNPSGAARFAARLVHSASACAGKIATDAGALDGAAGRRQRRLARIAGHASPRCFRDARVFCRSSGGRRAQPAAIRFAFRYYRLPCRRAGARESRAAGFRECPSGFSPPPGHGALPATGGPTRPGIAKSGTSS